MNEEAWPTPQIPPSEAQPRRGPLPRVEDLPVAEQGYEQESVRAAFDSFYRHAAQLDTALRTLEAVDSFHRHAAALRSELRSLRAAGWTQQSWTAAPTYAVGGRAAREGVSPAVWRIAGEVAFLIAVAVVAGVAKLHWWVIVLVMAIAWTIVLAAEWLAARDRLPPLGTAAAPHPVVEAEPVVETEPEDEARGWAAFEEAQEPSDAMTMIGSLVPDEQVEPEPEPEAEADPEPEPEPEPLPPAAEVARARAFEPRSHAEPEPDVTAEANPAPEPPQRRWWRRAPKAEEEAGGAGSALEAEPEPPKHVRVLPAVEPAPQDVDPWEQGFDLPVVEGPEDDEREPEVGEDTAEEPALAAEAERPRRLRRR